MPLNALIMNLWSIGLSCPFRKVDLGVRWFYNHTLSDAFFNADHDELIEVYIFSKKVGLPPAFVVK